MPRKQIKMLSGKRKKKKVGTGKKDDGPKNSFLFYPLRRWAKSRVVCWTALWNITLRMHHCHWARGGMSLTAPVAQLCLRQVDKSCSTLVHCSSAYVEVSGAEDGCDTSQSLKKWKKVIKKF